MKSKILLLSLLSLIAINVQAIDFNGFGGRVYYDGYNYSIEDDDAETSSLIISPYVILGVSDTLSLEPFLLIMFDIEEDSEDISSYADEDFSQTTFGLGASLVKSAYKNSLITFNYGFSTGLYFGLEPSGDSADYDSYSNTQFDLDCIISVDFNVTDNLKVRIAHDIVNFSIRNKSYESSSTSNEYSQTYTDFDTITSGFSPTFSVYYML